MHKCRSISYSGSMRNILIPTDFSLQSQSTLKSVLESLKETKDPTRVLLINTYMVDLGQEPGQLIQLNDELKNFSKRGLEREMSNAQKWITNPNVKIETASHMGSLTNVIRNLIRIEKFDLVAMGIDEGKRVAQVASLLKQNNGPLLATY